MLGFSALGYRFPSETAAGEKTCFCEHDGSESRRYLQDAGENFIPGIIRDSAPFGIDELKSVIRRNIRRQKKKTLPLVEPIRKA
jgi:hypothetical protein